MRSRRTTIAVLAAGLIVIGGCGDDAPTTNTVDGPTSNTVRQDAPGTSTASTEGNVGDITGSTPVAADDDVVQENQPMMSFVDD